MTNLYHYNDLTDLTCEQLFFWVAVDKTLVPIVGWIILGYDVIQIIKNTVVACNLIVKPEDRLPLT